jgi:hypothetical protein
VGVWLYQGEADPVVPAAGARDVAAALLQRKADFVYLELPGAEHGLPSAAEEDAYHYFEPRRRASAASGWPASSFRTPVTPAEAASLGDPGGAWGRTLAPEAADLELWAALERGHPDAEVAARRLAASPGPGAGERAAALVLDEAKPAYARRWAAWLAGRVGDEPARRALAALVRTARDASLVSAAARELGQARAADAVHDLRQALADAGHAWARPGEEQDRVPFPRLEASGAVLADLVEALGRVGRDVPEVPGEIEAHAVRGFLRDPRRATGLGPGDEPGEVRARVARAVGRAYRSLSAERTLLDMLRTVLKREPATLRAAEEGYAEGVR